jgi:hypothetical protein
MKRTDYKKWSILTIVVSLIFLVMAGLTIIIIDPFFHYHKPLSFLQYPINSEWYQNDGIARNFDYNALITGTSMTENFKTSEVNDLFNVTSVKIPYSGGSYKQINALVIQGIKNHPEMKIVIRGLDLNRLVNDDVNAIRSNVPFPKYLYNENILDDINYIFNKDVLLNKALIVLQYTIHGNNTTSFDDYANWNSQYIFGKKTLDRLYKRPDRSEISVEVTEKDYLRIAQNIEENVISIARNNPNIEFYYFITPYSIYYFDELNQTGNLDRSFLLQKAAIEQIIQIPNIKLFYFLDLYEDIEDLNNYKDNQHYGEWLNSDFLHYMKNDEHLLTKDNWQKCWQEVYDYFSEYDYDSLFNTEE